MTPYSLTPSAGGSEAAEGQSPSPSATPEAPAPETPTPAPTPAPDSTPELTPVEGGRCNAPPQAGAGFEASLVGGLIALAAFAVYNSTRRRRTKTTESAE